MAALAENFFTKNLAAWITIATISVGGIVSFSTLRVNVSALETRVEKLEDSNKEVLKYLNSIDKKLGLVACRISPDACLKE